MRYVLLVYMDEERVRPTAEEDLTALSGERTAGERASLSGERTAGERASLSGERASLAVDLRRGGVLGREVLLRSTRTATTVRVRNGRVALVDGPFAGTGEQLLGVHVIHARDLNDAIRTAARIPEARFGGVEVRPVREMEG